MTVAGFKKHPATVNENRENTGYAYWLKMYASRKRKIANHTYLHSPAYVGDKPVLAVRLHQTDVLTFYPNGDARLDSGGWKTVTTKDRMNRFLPDGWGLCTERGVWYLGRGSWGDPRHKEFVFKDGMTITKRGTVKGAAPKMAVKRDIKLRRDATRYAAAFTEALAYGQVGQPGPGDCLDCHMVTTDGQTLGDANKHSDHILLHIREQYFVPSLACNALKSGASQCARSVLSGYMHGDTKDMPDSWIGIGLAQIRKAIRKYVVQRLGLPA